MILPTIGDEAHLRAVATRVVRAVPEGASLLVAVAEPTHATLLATEEEGSAEELVEQAREDR